jgi:Transposase, Mutator family
MFKSLLYKGRELGFILTPACLAWHLRRVRAPTRSLEALVISGFVRGLSTRDVEAALCEVLGPEAALSKSTVSRICQAIKDEAVLPEPGVGGGPRPKRLAWGGHDPSRRAAAAGAAPSAPPPPTA